VADLETFDVLIAGAGTAGIPCAVEAAAAGASVLLVDKSSDVGGTLHVSGGHLSGAGTRRQRVRGIADSPEQHRDDVMRISDQTARADIVELATRLAAGTIDWLDEHGLAFHEASPRLIYGHEPYTVARTHYGVDEARSILAVLRPLLDEQVQGGGVTLWLRSPVVSLRTASGAVTGAVVERDGQRVEVAASAVVLATGGYGGSPELFAEIEGLPLWTAAQSTSTGDGLRLAGEVGAARAGAGMFLPTFGGLPEEGAPHRVVWRERPHLIANERPPWEIYVDRHGRRFVAEDEPSIDRKERELIEHVDDLTFHVVFDERARREAPPIVIGWSAEEVRDRANQREGLVAADRLEDLAVAAGIDPAGLIDTVEGYNMAVAGGRPDPLGRAHLPSPIAEPPFYALRNHGSTLITFAGVDVDEDLRVRRPDGTVIDGLFAAGEVIGAAATTGNAFCGGMLLTPAMAFGRLLGQRLGGAAAPSTVP
jgi:predicted flavoprotein YhiN